MDQIANQNVLNRSKQFVAHLRAEGMRVNGAYLFGSYATGHAHRDSDIDIAVVSQDLSGDWLDDYCRLTRIADDFDARMEVVSFCPRDFRDENPLVWQIKSTGIPLIRNGKNGKRRAIKKQRASKRK